MVLVVDDDPSANKDIKILAKKAKADYFLSKPFDIDHLIDVVKRYSAS